MFISIRRGRLVLICIIAPVSSFRNKGDAYHYCAHGAIAATQVQRLETILEFTLHSCLIHISAVTGPTRRVECEVLAWGSAKKRWRWRYSLVSHVLI